jgi:thiosulfate/3-mercaptopyruvate sulfurtransferase
MSEKTYAQPEVLVETQWLASHAADEGLRLIEVDVDTTAYAQGHILGAVGWNWQTQLQDLLRRTLATKRQFEALASEAGITPSTTVILYGDNNNWFAAWAFWQFKYYGHEDVRLLNGGRKKWAAEGRPLDQEVPHYPATRYEALGPDETVRAYRDQVFEVLTHPEKYNLVDVRSVDEYTGKIIAPPGLSETAQRAGHIPGARNIPWVQTVKEDGSFKPLEELQVLYANQGVTPDKETIAYCRIGERSSHSWFVLKYLLGYPNVRNYDGSWTEWGNLIEAPIERTLTLSQDSPSDGAGVAVGKVCR